ncbi:Glycoside hydrolase family 79 protein [Mycena kentingensis (nom. inval.)]|nr:Glycoside hydrolase family 79 protein [Mycena kentingensis (nom. inval.)]
MRAAVFASALVPFASAVSVSVPLVPPTDTPIVSRNLLSLSIEQDRWLDWSGTTTPNTYFLNLLNNIAALTGVGPHIRIGADSEDHTAYNPNVPFVQQSFPPPSTTVPYPEATSIVAGPGFYQAAQFLPKGTRVTWGINFGAKNLTAVYLETRAVLAAFASSAMKKAGVILDSLELGNEADLYNHNGLRLPGYNIAQYVPEWVMFASNMTTSAAGVDVWGCAFAASSHSVNGFSPQGAFANGLLSSKPGSSITRISQHHYSGSFCSGNEGLLQDLMTKATIRSNLSSFLPDIAATQEQGLDYVLGETNSYSCHGAPGVSNTAGASLWTLDYALFASQIGVSQLFFHEGIGYKYNLIQPAVLTRSTIDGSTLSQPQQPHIQPQYYAAIIIAEAIGKSGNTRVLELDIDNDRLSGYAFYEGSTLKRAVFINSLAFTTGTRASTHISLSMAGSGSKPAKFTVKRLAIKRADDVSGLTWGGQNYETSSGLVGGTATTETGTVSAGIDIAATQAILVSFS